MTFKSINTKQSSTPWRFPIVFSHGTRSGRKLLVFLVTRSAGNGREPGLECQEPAILRHWIREMSKIFGPSNVRIPLCGIEITDTMKAHQYVAGAKPVPVSQGGIVVRSGGVQDSQILPHYDSRITHHEIFPFSEHFGGLAHLRQDALVRT